MESPKLIFCECCREMKPWSMIYRGLQSRGKLMAVCPACKEYLERKDKIIDYGDRKTLRFVCEKCNREIGGMPPYEKFKAFCPSCKNLTWFNPKKKRGITNETHQIFIYKHR